MIYQVKIWDIRGDRTSELECENDAEAIEILPLYEPDGLFRLELWQGERPVLIAGPKKPPTQ